MQSRCWNILMPSISPNGRGMCGYCCRTGMQGKVIPKFCNRTRRDADKTPMRKEFIDMKTFGWKPALIQEMGRGTSEKTLNTKRLSSVFSIHIPVIYNKRIKPQRLVAVGHSERRRGSFHPSSGSSWQGDRSGDRFALFKIQESRRDPNLYALGSMQSHCWSISTPSISPNGRGMCGYCCETEIQ